MGAQISVDDAVVRSYMLNASILVTKMLLMAPLTTAYRLSKRIFANPEDAKYFKPVNDSAKIKFDDPDIERVRRAHLNDLENIPAFLFTGGLYVLTRPSPFLASALFSAYTVCRVGHSLVYAVYPIRQPARMICFTGGIGITLFMAANVALYAIM